MANVQHTLTSRPASERGERPRARLQLQAIRGVLVTLASLVVGLGIWQFLSSVLFNPFLIPPPTEVFRTALPMLASGEIFADIGISMSRILVGFVSGSAALSCSYGTSPVATMPTTT